MDGTRNADRAHDQRANQKIAVREAIIVEGKYDKIKLSAVVDGLIIETGGFRIFKDREKMQMLRELARRRGLLILTDSDRAGFVIRGYLRGAIPEGSIRNAYIPDILGKERRKAAPSKEGKLGVEGMELQTLRDALERAGVTPRAPQERPPRRVTKTDFYEAGLSGGQGSAQRRARLCRELSLPENLSAKGLLEMVNVLMDFEEYRQTVSRLFKP
ncbi:toprim domain-containing protein [Feifania hominis]|uniref:DUF4093 domain-containing protein n=1 Tax=Feifania hominis TaxID=2763660 RepID=A0A926DE17_9FIRM|nr:DUF4093 domain-containing protein [Feifania hominis]MBC8536127.1 DUF4093 domain-containing protein [Feifania hominis]